MLISGLALRRNLRHSSPMNDRDVYLKLSAIAEQLTQMAAEAESFVGQAACNSLAQSVAGTAKAIYEHLLHGDEH
jgi:hypothetical protein